MLWIILRNTWRDWVAKQFAQLPSSYHYYFVDGYLRKQVDAGKANYFHKLLDSQREMCYNNNVERS